MTLPEFSVKRKITVLMVALLTVVIGGVALSKLGLDFLPEMNFPMITIMTAYQGAAPEDVEKNLTKPLEQVIASTNNLKSIKSYSQQGLSVITVEFNWGTNLDFAAQDIREYIEQIRAMLPSDAGRPMVLKFSTAQFPVLACGMTGMKNTVRFQKLIDENVSNELERLDGVATVFSMSMDEREINAFIDKNRLEALGLSYEQIVNAIRFQNMDMPAGRVVDNRKDYSIRMLGAYKSVDELGATVVGAAPDGTPIHLSDIAHIADTLKDLNYIADMNGKPGVFMMVMKQSGSNTLKVVNAVKKKLATLWKSRMPKGTGYFIVMDFGHPVSRLANFAGSNLVIGALLAVFMLYLFLRNWKPTIAIAVAIPLSVVATFIPLWAAGYTLNMMTLGGLALGVGMLVDNAVVVIENIYRLMENGVERQKAASKGASDVSAAITAFTLTTVSVFVPLFFVSGIAGQLAHGLVLTITFALAASLFVALTIVPAMAAAWFSAKGKHGRKAKFIEALRNWYRGALTNSLIHRERTLWLVVATVLLSCAVIPFIGMEFMPRRDTPMLVYKITLPVGTPIDETYKYMQLLEKIVWSTPGVESSIAQVGVYTEQGNMSSELSPEGTNEATLMIHLVNSKKRDKSSIEIGNDIREQFPDFANVELQKIPMEQMMSGVTNAVEVKVYGDNLSTLGKISNQIIDILKNIDGVVDPHSDLKQSKPELKLHILRDKAAAYGLTAGQIAMAVSNYTQGVLASRYRDTDGEEYDIRVRLRKQDRENIKSLENLQVKTPMGTNVPLQNLVRFERSTGPVRIYRDSQNRVVTVVADRQKKSVSSIMNKLKKALVPLKEALPEGYSIDENGGEYKQMNDTFKDFAAALLLAILLVYMVMAAQFESLKDPFVIMFTIPLAGVGVLWIFFLTQATLSVPSFIGVIMLAGIVVNNGIVMIDHIKHLIREENYSPHDAVIQGATDRMRPVFITAGTTILGMIPMALRSGEGAEMMRPMALTVIGGLLSATFFTLFVVPAVYSLIERIRFSKE